MQLNLSNIEYTYPSTAEPALRAVTATFPRGWTGIIGDNGGGQNHVGADGLRAFAARRWHGLSIPLLRLLRPRCEGAAGKRGRFRTCP